MSIIDSGNDPNRIDIELALIGASGQESLNRLIKTMQSLDNRLRSLSLAPTTANLAQQAVRLSGGEVGPAGIIHGVSAGASIAGMSPQATTLPSGLVVPVGAVPQPTGPSRHASLPPDARTTAEMPTVPSYTDPAEAGLTARQRLRYIVSGSLPGGQQGPSDTGIADRFFRASTLPNVNSDPFLPTGGHGDGTPSANASIPEGLQGEDAPGWARHIDFGRASRPMDISRVGFNQLSTQGKLELASDFLARRAIGAQRRGGTGNQFGTGAAALNWAAGQAATVSTVGNILGRWSGYSNINDAHLGPAALHPFTHPLQALYSYQNIGRAEGMGLNPSELGFGRNPFAIYNDPGVAEGALAAWQAGTLGRRYANVTADVGAHIEGALISQGYSGRERAQIASQVAAPLVNQGLNPDILIPQIDQALRWGNTPMKDFVATLTNLGPSARRARMGLDEFQQSLGEFATDARDRGATFVQGAQQGLAITNALGVTPQVANQLVNNPQIQAFTMMQTGSLPFQQGLLGGSAIVNSTRSAMNLALRAAQGFAQPTTEANQFARGGHITVSARDNQIAAAANFLGLSPDEFKNLQRNNTSRTSVWAQAEDAWRHGGARGYMPQYLRGLEHARIITGAQREQILRAGPDQNKILNEIFAHHGNAIKAQDRATGRFSTGDVPAQMKKDTIDAFSKAVSNALNSVEHKLGLTPAAARLVTVLDKNPIAGARNNANTGRGTAANTISTVSSWFNPNG